MIDSELNETTPFQLTDKMSATPIVDLSAHELALKTKIESIYKVDISKTRLPRLVWNKRLQQLLREAEKLSSCIETYNLTKTSSLLYAMQ